MNAHLWGRQAESIQQKVSSLFLSVQQGSSKQEQMNVPTGVMSNPTVRSPFVIVRSVAWPGSSFQYQLLSPKRKEGRRTFCLQVKEGLAER